MEKMRRSMQANLQLRMLPTRPPARGPEIEWLVSRYQNLRPWVFLSQVFLAVGWCWVTVGLAVDPTWWSGEAISTVIDGNQGAVYWYSIVLETIIEPLAMVTVIAIVGVQLITSLLLALNWKPLLAVSVGAFLNINFMLAGRVVPSIFFLVLGATTALWHLRHDVDLTVVQAVERRSWILVAVSVGALATDIDSLAPDTLAEQPAVALIFIVTLWAISATLLRSEMESSPTTQPDVQSATVRVAPEGLRQWQGRPHEEHGEELQDGDDQPLLTRPRRLAKANA